jgi:hypothetical protein
MDLNRDADAPTRRRPIMSRNAIWQGRRYREVGEHTTHEEGWVGSILDPLTGGEVVVVRFGDPSLIIDPTDAQWEAAKAGLPIPADPDADVELPTRRSRRSWRRHESCSRAGRFDASTWRQPRRSWPWTR